MFVVRNNYEKKAQKYVRLHGSLNFSPGGSFADVIESIDESGIVPNEVYTGLMGGAKNHNHGEMDKALDSYVKAVITNKTLSKVWKNGLNGILDAYLGVKPSSFTYNGKEYTPESFRDFLGIKKSDYVSLTSFSDHPFYSKYVLEIPDNWRWAFSYNVPIEELIETMDNAIMNGYTIAWASDVSENGFSRNGIAIMPDENASENAGSDQAKWTGLSDRERMSSIREKIGKEILVEKKITDEMRQEAYDNYLTTDDHGMQIYGIAKDQNGNKYYMVKNSWGKTGNYDGFWYVSESFVKYKTLSIMINKAALPKDVEKKIKF